MAARVAGLNHLTLGVSDVSRSIAFYRDGLGLRLRACWPEGAYLEAGTLWLCLTLDPDREAGPRADYTHVAFDVAATDFEELSGRLSDAPVWKQNRSEGSSLYCLDPDGHKIELHVGTLASRLDHYRNRPTQDRRIFDD